MAANHRAGVADDPAALLPISAVHIAAVLLCAVGFAIDLSEFAVGNALSAIFSKGPKTLPAVELAVLVGAAYAGAAIGAPVFGRLADRHGFRRLLVWMLVWLGVATAAAGASTTTLELISARFVAGLALGGYPPVMIAYLADIAPGNRRGRLILWSCAIAYLGPPAMIFGVRWLTPLEPLGVEGWRWALGMASALAVCAAVGLRILPEAPSWLEANGELGAAGIAPAEIVNPTDLPSYPLRSGRTFMSGAVRGRLVAYAAGYATIAIATVAFPLVTGPVLLARGVSLTDALYYVGVGSLGPFLATLLASLVIDRVSRHTALTITASIMLLAVALFFSGPGTNGLVVAVLAFAIGMALYLPTIAALGAESFPLRIRGAATSTGWAANRLAASVTPLLVLPLVRGDQVWLVMAIILGSLLATIALLQVAARNNAADEKFIAQVSEKNHAT